MKKRSKKLCCGIFFLVMILLCVMVVPEGEPSSASGPGKPKLKLVKRTKKNAYIQIKSKGSVTCYHVYVKKGKTGKYRLETFILHKKTAKLKLKKLKKNQEYYMKVRATLTSRGRIRKGSFSKSLKIPSYKKKKKKKKVKPTPKPTAKPTPKPTAKPTAAPVVKDEGKLAKQVLRYVNAERKKEGLAAYTLDQTLCQAAKKRAQELTTKYSHDRPDGSSFLSVLKEFSYDYRVCAENIAEGQATPKEVVESWMKSTDHRANILNTECTKMGVGFVQTKSGFKYYWVQLFAG